MSYCELITFRNGKPAESVEYGNSWGGAAYIWDVLYTKYLKDPKKEYDHWMSRRDGDRSLWDLYKRKDIPMFMRAVHMASFDRAIVSREHFAEYAQHLREFVQYFGTNGKVCHLTEWAKFLDTCDADAIGFYATSVGENLWHTYNEETEEYIPYDLNKGDKHFEVYDALAQVDSNEEAA